MLSSPMRLGSEGNDICHGSFCLDYLYGQRFHLDGRKKNNKCAIVATIRRAELFVAWFSIYQRSMLNFHPLGSYKDKDNQKVHTAEDYLFL
jgi:hypothetical protein